MLNDFLCKYQNTPSKSSSIKPPVTKIQQKKNLKIWGDFNYDFRFNTQGESLYQTSILYADAESSPGFPFPIKCNWFRIKNERTYQIPEISSNVYQLSAEDIGCKIRVEAKPIEEDEFPGVAYGEFGPIELDPSARQTLEHVLGTGGSQFPVTVLFSGTQTNFHRKSNVQESTDSQEIESIEANLYVNSHVIKLCFIDSFGGTANEDAIALKYTIDYPKLELHPYDTQRFKIIYSDDKVDAKYKFNKCIELKALSRQSRDLIALAIKCFSAHTYYINSKIISDINKDQKSEEKLKESQNQTTMSEVLFELEFVKRELYNQINCANSLSEEKRLLKDDMRKMEEEMQVTIESYKNILETFEQDDQTGSVKMKREIFSMTKQIEDLQTQRQTAIQEKIVLADEQKELNKKLQQYKQLEQSLREEIELIGNQMGIPKSEFEKVKVQLAQKEQEIFQSQQSSETMKKRAKELQNSIDTLMQQQEQLKKDKETIQQYLHAKEDEVAQLRQDVRNLQQENSSQKQQVSSQQVQEFEKQILNLTEENESLMAQRKTLTKSKESVTKDLDKIRREFEASKLEFESNLERLRKANERMVEQNNQSENEKEEIINQKQSLAVKIQELEVKILEQRQDYENKIKELESSQGKGKKFDLLAAMLEDDEDSIDIEKTDKCIQTDKARYEEISIQTDQIEESKKDTSTKNKIDRAPSAKQTPQKQNTQKAVIRSSITLDTSQKEKDAAQQKEKEAALQKEKEVALQKEKEASLQKEKEAALQKEKDLNQQQIMDEKNKQIEELTKKAEKLDSDLANTRYEKNHEKSSLAKQISEMQMQNQMLVIERQEKDGCIKRLKELIDDRDIQIDNLQKELQRIAMRLCTSESRLFELENN